MLQSKTLAQCLCYVYWKKINPCKILIKNYFVLLKDISADYFFYKVELKVIKINTSL